MRLIYNRYKRFFWILGLLLGVGVVDAYAQSTPPPPTPRPPFKVDNQCMLNPECEDDVTTFSDTTDLGVAWRWNFGDAASDDNTDTSRITGHGYQSPGTYTVSLVRTRRNGTVDSLSTQIQVGQLPPSFQNWKPDTTICPDQTITLDPYPNGGAPEGAKYIWYPKGDTTQTLQVDSSGCYSVEVILPSGCKIQDRVNVKICLEPSEQQGAKWYFGANAGLDFAGGDPKALTDGELIHPRGYFVHCQLQR